jgi:hypothetical protein
MIKINLLLARKEKKKIGIQKELIVLVASIVLLFLAFGFFHWKLRQEKEETLARISKTQSEIAHYKSLTTEVKRPKKLRKYSKISSM